MRVLLINLPHPVRIQRRFRCSYQAPRFLFPPLELLSVGGALRKAGIGPVRLIDAIAQNWSINKTVDEVRDWKPDVIITMPGFDILEDDLKVLALVRKAAAEAAMENIGLQPESYGRRPKTILFGYLVSEFPKEILEFSGADAVVVGEPETAILDYLKSSDKSGSGETQRVCQCKTKSAKNLDNLPGPDYSLVALNNYGDFLFDKPFAVLQTSRGCPFSCIYCVRPYGRKVAYHSAERIIEEVTRLKNEFGIRGLRFEDDTFPLNAKRAVAIARGIAPLGIGWSCLSRPDTIDEEIAAEFAKSGCKRIYLGIESASDRLLKWLGRGHTAKDGLDAARAIKKAGIEVAGFFLVGIPGETDNDLSAAVELARQADLDYVGVSTLIPYPGTRLFESGEFEVSFKLLPFYSHFEDEKLREEGRMREKSFYRQYYYNPRYIIGRVRTIARHPADAIRAAATLTRHLVSARREGKHGDLI